MPLGYRAGLYFDKWEENIQNLSALATTKHILMPCGSGGVPPQEDTVQMADEWNSEHTDYKIVIATPSEFFNKFEGEKKHLAVYRGELYSAYLENVFPDVASSRISLKLAIKNSENSLILAEKVASLAYILNKPYPTEQMTGMWKKMLFLSNHDIMPSTGIDDIYKEVYDYIDEIEATSQSVVTQSLSHLINTHSDGKNKHSVLVFNPYNWEVTDWVEVDLELDKDWLKSPCLTFENEEVDVQIIKEEKRDDGTISKVRIGFLTNVPPMGYRVYGICKKHKPVNSTINVNGMEIITDHFKVTINDQNGIIQVFDKDGFKVLEGNELVMDAEVGDLYFHENPLERYIASESGKGMRFGAFKPESCEVKWGPLKTVIEYKSNYYCLRWPYY
jgi:alpha-mannosidase